MFLTSLFVAGGLDNGDGQFRNLVIQACDGGTPMLCGNSSLRITVFGSSSGLTFDPSFYATDVCFHSAVSGMTLMQLVAIDGDSRPNEEVKYSLIWKSTLFDVNSSTGQVVLARTPRSTDLGSSIFYVEASDGGELLLTAHTVGTIQIVHCTEHTFYFTSPFHHIRIYEGHRTFTNGNSTVEIGLSHVPTNVSFSKDTPTNPFMNTLNVNLKIKNKH